MKYLFFDVECSNCHHRVGKICEYGYVLTDENFNILLEDVIPMSPGKSKWARFDLGDRKGNVVIKLAYEYDFYLSQPEFPRFYQKIKKLMEGEDVICFAYSMENDISHMQTSCERYKLEPLNYTCVDVQKIVGRYLNIKEQMNLEKACLQIAGPNSLIGLQEHLSRDDAKMEMKILEAICALTNKTSKEVLNESKFATANSLDFMRRYRKRMQEKDLRRANAKFYQTLVSTKEILEDPNNVGKRFNISGNICKDRDVLTKLIEKVKNKGGLLSNHISTTDTLIVFNDSDREAFYRGINYNYEGIVVTAEEFLKDEN